MSDSQKMYMIELPHTKDDCMQALQLAHINGYLKSFYWGCNHGEHTAVMLVESDSEDMATHVLPPLLRPKARVIPVSKFSDAEIEQIKASDGAGH
jgi:hypothetical protein